MFLNEAFINDYKIEDYIYVNDAFFLIHCVEISTGNKIIVK